MSLLAMATLKLPVFWSSRKLTSLPGPGASALPPLTIFHSLSALQPWQNCTEMRHRRQPSQGCCIPAQHRRELNDAHPPRCRCPNKSSSCSCRRRGGGSFKKYKRKMVVHTSQSVTVPVLMYAPLVHAVATALAWPADADLFC